MVDKFCEMLASDDADSRSPIVIDEGDIRFLHTSHNNFATSIITKRNECDAHSALYRVVEVSKIILNQLEEESIRDNFVLIYELLDEMMDSSPKEYGSEDFEDYICVWRSMQ